MVMPTYKEPFTVLEATLATIEAQTVAHNLMVVVSLEQRSPEREHLTVHAADLSTNLSGLGDEEH